MTGTRKIGDQVGAEEHAAVVLHVAQLDGKNVGGLPQFVGGKKQRSGLFLLDHPPAHYRRDAAQFFDGQRAQNAQDIQIGVRWMKIAARG